MIHKQFKKSIAIAVALSVTMGTAISAIAADNALIRINRSPVGQFEPLYIGLKQGYFSDVGIDLEMKIGSSPDQAIAEVLAGSVDLAMTGIVPTVAAVSRGLPIVTVINTQDQGTTPTFGLLVKKDSDVKSIADLKGKKIGLAGIAGPQGIALLLELEAQGISIDEVELVNLPFAGVLSAMDSGAVDAGIPLALFYGLAKQKGYREFTEVYNRTIGTPAVVYVANKNWIAENEELLQKFNSAMKLAYAYANEHPDEVRAIDKEYTKLPPEYLDNRYIAEFVSAIDTGKMQELNESTKKFGFLKSIPQASEYIWSGAETR